MGLFQASELWTPSQKLFPLISGYNPFPGCFNYMSVQKFPRG